MWVVRVFVKAHRPEHVVKLLAQRWRFMNITTDIIFTVSSNIYDQKNVTNHKIINRDDIIEIIQLLLMTSTPTSNDIADVLIEEIEYHLNNPTRRIA